MNDNNPPSKSNVNRIVFALALIAVPAILIWIYFAPQSGGDPTFETMQRSEPAKSQLEQMEEMWKTAPGHGPIALELANQYFMSGKYDKALEFYREFMRTDTTADGWLVRLDISRTLVSLGRTEDAILELKGMLKDHPGYAGALYNLGAIEANRGNNESAREIWTELIKLHPDDSLATYAKNALPKLKPTDHP